MLSRSCCWSNCVAIYTAWKLPLQQWTGAKRGIWNTCPWSWNLVSAVLMRDKCRDQLKVKGILSHWTALFMFVPCTKTRAMQNQKARNFRGKTTYHRAHLRRVVPTQRWRYGELTDVDAGPYSWRFASTAAHTAFLKAFEANMGIMSAFSGKFGYFGSSWAHLGAKFGYFGGMSK